MKLVPVKNPYYKTYINEWDSIKTSGVPINVDQILFVFNVGSKVGENHSPFNHILHQKRILFNFLFI